MGDIVILRRLNDAIAIVVCIERLHDMYGWTLLTFYAGGNLHQQAVPEVKYSRYFELTLRNYDIDIVCEDKIVKSQRSER